MRATRDAYTRPHNARARAFPVFLTRASGVAEIFTEDMRFFFRTTGAKR